MIHWQSRSSGLDWVKTGVTMTSYGAHIAAVAAVIVLSTPRLVGVVDTTCSQIRLGGDSTRAAARPSLQLVESAPPVVNVARISMTAATMTHRW